MADPNILVVDDDQAILDLVLRRLERRGLRADSAADGPSALALMKDKRYDLIVTDIYMPGGMTGLEVLHKAKELDPHVQVIVVTAAAALDNAVEALNEGAFGYLLKPFDHLSVIDNSVTRALDYRRLILDNLRLAEIQRRRGDMLEAELTDRIQLMRRKQQDTAEMLARLPVGIIVADAEGRPVLTNAVAEQLIKRRTKDGKQPIQDYLARLVPPTYPTNTDLTLDDISLRLSAQPLPPVQGKIRTLIVLQERDPQSGGGGDGSLVARLKPAIDWLAERPLPATERDVVRGLQTQLLALERLEAAEGGPLALPSPGGAREQPARIGGAEPARQAPATARAGASPRDHWDDLAAALGAEREAGGTPAPKSAPERSGLLKKGLARKAGAKPDGGDKGKA